MYYKLLKRLKKRSVRVRGTILATVVVFAIFWLTGAISSVWIAIVGAMAIVMAALWSRRRRKLPNRLLKSGKRKKVDPAVLTGAFIAALPDPAVLMDGDGNITLHNDKAQAIFGGPREGAHISSAVRAPQILDAIDRVTETGEDLRVDYSTTVPFEQHFEALITPVESGPDGAMLLLMRDLTKLELADRLRAEFVANASHELKTPLASLLGFVETLQGSAKDDAKARDRFLAIMHAEASRMSRLISDLMSLNRIELNAHMLPQDQVDVENAVRHVAETLAPIATEAGVELDISVAGADSNVQGDHDELIQVFQNLVENAIKYGKSGGRVELTVTSGPIKLRGDHMDGVEIIVRDFGPGLAPGDIPRLTERFFRVDKSHSQEIGGTGLGLAIVKHILNRHRGLMTVESSLGAGAAFKVVLPLADSPLSTRNTV